MCWDTEMEDDDQSYYLTHLQYTDTRPTSLNTDPVMPGALKGASRVPSLKSLV